MEEKNVSIDDSDSALESDLLALASVGQPPGSLPSSSSSRSLSGSSGGGGAADKNKPTVRRALPVQRIGYGQLQAATLRQEFDTNVQAHMLVCLLRTPPCAVRACALVLTLV